MLIVTLALGMTLLSGITLANHKKHDFNITRSTYPDPNLTPGDMYENISLREICTHGYSSRIRNVNPEHKQFIKRMYEIDPSEFSEYSIDHFIPLCLGGTNSLMNLWPQRITNVVYGTKEKAKSDDYLFQQVCDGQMSLKEAQRLILKDWVAVYKKCCVKPNQQTHSGKRVFNGQNYDFEDL